ncbi:unnamed protein product [Lactuca virosa]|uniref:Uncharacterized protein n=1 Tax=Lactuca virosa TaxID=75947 RepID=A0AAU9LWN0_9ASTR|nr:unnamed protein product [Lactuca virosa]
MCPLRIILIFLSATLAGFFVLRNIKSQSDTSLDTDAATAAADDSTSFCKSSPSASVGRSSSKIYGAFFLLPNNRINLLILWEFCVDVGFLFYVQFGTGLDMNLCFDHSVNLEYGHMEDLSPPQAGGFMLIIGRDIALGRRYLFSHP